MSAGALGLPELGLPELGHGIGLRPEHYQAIVRRWPEIDWLQAVAEDFMAGEGRPLHFLERVAERYPVTLFASALSLGSAAPPDRDYLARLGRLAERVGARWIVAAVGWTSAGGAHLQQPLPLPYDDGTLRHIVERVSLVADIVRRPLVLANPCRYASLAASTMSEARFLGALAGQTGCGLALDLTHLHVSAVNDGVEPCLPGELPPDCVAQVGLAGHVELATHAVDTHDRPVADAVWDLYEEWCRRGAGGTTLVEWDVAVPGLSELRGQALEAARRRASALAQPSRDGGKPISLPRLRGVGEGVSSMASKWRIRGPRAPSPALPPEGGGSHEAEKHQSPPACTSGAVLELGALQRWLVAAVTHPGGPEPGIAAAAQAMATDACSADAVVRAPPGATAIARLGIYSDMHRWRLLDVLAPDYPATRHAMGQELFEHLALEYLAIHPPRHHDLSRLGAGLPEWLAAQADRLQDGALHCSLARLERAVEEVRDERRSGALGPSDLQERIARVEDAAAWGGLRLRTIPALRLVAAEYPVNAYLQAVMRGQCPPRPFREPSWTLVWRTAFELWREELTAPQHAILAAFERGEPLAEALACAAALPGTIPEELAASVGGWFRGWATRGVFEGVDA